MRIIFMGTPDFAVASLDQLVQNGYNVVAVITATDKYGGRGGKQLIQSAVKRYALQANIPVLQPKNLKSPKFVEEVRAFQADLQVVVAFRMLPEVIWNMPPLGTYNLHGSLLPKYRGAAPINWAVINGDKETGVTTFKLKHVIDTGDLLLQRSMPIHEEDTAGTVHDRMMELGAATIVDTVKLLEDGQPTFTPQDEALVSKAPKIFHETCEIDWSASTDQIYDFIRGLSPYPGAWTTIDGKEVKIYWADRDTVEHDENPGQIVSDGKRYLRIASKDGYLFLKDIKMQGKRKMDIQSFLNGYKVESHKVG